MSRSNSTFRRIEQSAIDYIDAVFAKYCFSKIPGGYPINPNQQEAYAAGENRGMYAAYGMAIRSGSVQPVLQTELDFGGTYAEQGFADGFRAVQNAFSRE